jgi:CRP-like cAMP-binding protein
VPSAHGSTVPCESSPVAALAGRLGLARDPLLAAVAGLLGGEALSPVRTRLVRRGDVLAAAHEPVTAVYAVLSGRLGVFRPDDAGVADVPGVPGGGRPRLHEVLGPGQRAREADLLSACKGPPGGAWVQCLTGSVVAVIDAGLFRHWCARPDIAMLVAREIAEQTLAVQQRGAAWAELDVAARLVAVLLELHERFGSVRSAGGRTFGVISHGLSQAELGDLIGARRETVNRATRTLEAEGLLMRGGRGAALFDLPALAARAGCNQQDQRVDSRAVS